jgi:signal transduction histidine kinase
VRAPYYATWWFRLSAAAAVLALVVGFYTYRLAELRRRQELRLAIAGRLHDDVSADLASIAMKADLIARDLILSSDRRGMLEEIGRAARDSALMVRETVWVVSTRYDTLPQLVTKMSDTADTLLVGQLEHTFSTPSDELPAVELEWELRQDVYLLFKESLSNALRHARATRVDIQLTYSAPELAVRISDDGIGFDPSNVREGNGLGLMRARMSKHRGDLRISGARGEGTTVEFRVLVR